ncbi:MAG: hypothetical protein IKF39_07020 [Oscillospiraceae bacterium]|nr:hypothetical protein [Oscillospiraceae bacterium]
MKRIASVLIILCICFCFTSCGENNRQPVTNNGFDSHETANNASGLSFKVGDTIKCKDFNVTLEKADVVPYIGNYVTNDGELFLLLGTTVENTSSSVLSFSSDDYSVYCDGRECTLTSLSDNTYYDYEDLWLSKDIAVSKKSKILISAYVPERFKEIEIRFANGSFQIETKDLGSLTPNLLTFGKEYNVGEGFRALGFDIFVEKVIQTDYISSGSSFYYEPDAGKHFILIFVEATNNTGSVTRFNYLRLEPYVDDYSAQYTGVSYSTEVDGDSCIDEYSDVQPGKKIRGFVMLEVKDGWKTIELMSREATLVINANDVEIR